MALRDIKGNDRLIDEIRRFTAGGNVHHAYIIEGPASAKKMELAKSFAQALFCEDEPGEGCGSCRICRNIESEDHIDIKYVEPDKVADSNASSIKVKQVEEVIGFILKKPSEGKRAVVIFDDFDKMTLDAMNMLLKTLEEPPEGTVIMMLSENASLLPQTIVSRSVVLRMLSFEDKDDPYHQKAEQLIEAIASRADHKTVCGIFEDIQSDREEAVLFLDSLEDAYRERLLGRTRDMKKEDVFRAVAEIEDARQKIRKSAIVQYALKSMAMRIGGTV